MRSHCLIVICSEWERKSISTERTFPDISKPDEMFEKCRQICTSLAEEVAENQLKGKTVTLKLKTSHFEVKQRSMSFPHYIHSFDVIYKSATNLLENELQSCENLQLRLMG
jgi:DNA polymerase kappa